MSADCDACRTCLGCGRSWCMEERPSPGEPDLCDNCYEEEDAA